MLVLRERIVLIHYTVTAARLQDAMIDARIGHLRHHKGGRRLHSLHAYRHILDRVALALIGKFESAIGTDTKADIINAGPGIVLRPEQHSRFHFLAIAKAKRLRRRTCHVLLDVFEVNIDGRVATGTIPILEDVGVAVDDHFAHADDLSDVREQHFATERPPVEFNDSIRKYTTDAHAQPIAIPHPRDCGRTRNRARIRSAYPNCGASRRPSS